MTRDCCATVPPIMTRQLFADWMIYCPICGYTVYGHTQEEAREKWKEYREENDDQK